MLGKVLDARDSMVPMTDIVLGLRISVLKGWRTFTGVEHLHRWIFPHR